MHRIDGCSHFPELGRDDDGVTGSADYQRFPETAGRNIAETQGEIGLAGLWLKRMLHTAFICKAKALPLWYMIPE